MFLLAIFGTLLSLSWGFSVLSLDNGRIVGGEDASVKDFPYQASLFRYSPFCGGSLLNESLILTAAHCTYGKTHQNLYIYAGTDAPGVGPAFKTVSKILQHPDFSMDTVDNDISILVLSSPFKYSNVIKAIRLPPKGYQVPEGKMATVTGFGTLSEGGEKPKGLRKLQVPILLQKRCNELYAKVNKTLTEHMFCAGFEEGGKDSCQGDSGGPLVLDGMQIGVVSWGYGCARPGLPGVYTHISTLLDFVESNVGTIQNVQYHDQ